MRWRSCGAVTSDPMGTVALILALALQAVAAGALLDRPFGWLQLVVLLCLSRAALLFGCIEGVSAARPDGLGALVAGSVSVPRRGDQLAGRARGGPGRSGARRQVVGLPPIGVLAAVLACWLVLRCVRRLGGVTGDVLGALVEVCATVLLVTATAWPQPRR